MAKKILALLLILSWGHVHAQSVDYNDIYDACFNDMSNFIIVKEADKPAPREIVVIENTMKWNPKRFWAKELAQVSPALRRTHPIKDSAVYLFRDSLLDISIADQEKFSLHDRAAKSKSGVVKSKGKHYKTELTPNDVRGYYVMTTEPLLTNDGQFAFIDMALFQNIGGKKQFRPSYLANVCAVYRKMGGSKKWTKFRVIDRMVKQP